MVVCELGIFAHGRKEQFIDPVEAGEVLEVIQDCGNIIFENEQTQHIFVYIPQIRLQFAEVAEDLLTYQLLVTAIQCLLNQVRLVTLAIFCIFHGLLQQHYL